jgi:hypothetical protein
MHVHSPNCPYCATPDSATHRLEVCDRYALERSDLISEINSFPRDAPGRLLTIRDSYALPPDLAKIHKPLLSTLIQFLKKTNLHNLFVFDPSLHDRRPQPEPQNQDDPPTDPPPPGFNQPGTDDTRAMRPPPDTLLSAPPERRTEDHHGP